MSEEYVRRAVGAKFYAKAFRVTSPMECSQRYGSRSKTKDFCWVVLEVVNKKKSLKHNIYFILVEYDLVSGAIKRR